MPKYLNIYIYSLIYNILEIKNNYALHLPEGKVDYQEDRHQRGHIMQRSMKLLAILKLISTRI